VSGFETLDDEECGSSGTLTLGRTEYTVGIQSRDTGDEICTLKYSEWGPNNRDSDLHSQYFNTMDHKYVYSRHDGSIFGFDHAQMDDRKLYTQKFLHLSHEYSTLRDQWMLKLEILLLSFCPNLLPHKIGKTFLTA
jgi:hypothetical protein